MLMWCTSLFCARTKHKTHFSKEPVSITKELKREKAPNYYEEYFQASKHGLYFLSFWRCGRVCWLLLARGQYHMGSICMRCHDQRLVS